MVSKDVAEPETATSLATVSSQFDTATLRSITSLDDALRTLNEAGITIRDASEEMGDGFELLDDKEKGQLVGKQFVILSANESPGDYGKTFVTLRVITEDGRKLIVNDGGTGIRDQVVAHVSAGGVIVGQRFPNGLRSSTYSFCEQCKNIVNKPGVEACSECGHSPMAPGTTYYLDLSK